MSPFIVNLNVQLLGGAEVEGELWRIYGFLCSTLINRKVFANSKENYELDQRKGNIAKPYWQEN